MISVYLTAKIPSCSPVPAFGPGLEMPISLPIRALSLSVDQESLR